MDESEYKMPRKFTFDEYYELLKEYVNDPEARKALEVYDAEYAAGRGRDHADYSEKAHDAIWDFIIAGWDILSKRGWPTYKEAIELSKEPGMKKLREMANEFPRLARRLIRVEIGSPLPLVEVNFEDKESVRKFLISWSRETRAAQPVIFPEVM